LGKSLPPFISTCGDAGIFLFIFVAAGSISESMERIAEIPMKKCKHRKTWREKLAVNKGFPKICKIDSSKSKRWGRGTFVIPAPTEVRELGLPRKNGQ
jgi:hypothetical protein